ncbi:flippase [Planktomarina temperata]|nr:flippase [Planktomarina temperata]
MIIQNLYWIYAEQFVRFTVGVLIGAWMARYFGPTVFGELIYVMSITTVVAFASNFGMKNILLKDIVNKEKSQSTIISSSMALKVVFALAIIFPTYIFIFITYDHSAGTKVTLLSILIISVLLNPTDLFTLLYQVDMKNYIVSIAKMLTLISFSIVKVALIMNKGSVVSLAIIIVFEHAVMFFTIIILNKIYYPNIHYFSVDYEYCKSLLSKSFPLLISSLSIVIYTKIDIFMLELLMEPKYVGIYGAGIRVSESAALLLPLFVSTVFPVVLKLYSSDIQQFGIILQKVLNFAVAFSFFISTIIFIASDEIIDFLYGPDYHEASLILGIHVISIVFINMGVVTSVWLIANGLQKIAMQRSLVALCANIALNFIMIPFFGMAGAAFATLLTHFFANFIWDFVNTNFRSLARMKLKSLNPVNIFNIKGHVAILNISS